MDQQVIDAQIRWPDVPAAYGWLSLDPRGNWRLHESGTSSNGEPGATIANQQIVGFINRNYTHDDHGHWFFQNGPQRVFVRLDAAALILHDGANNGSFTAHTGEDSGAVQGWWLDDQGRLFARTPLGPGMIVDRDLMAVLDAMTLHDGSPSAATSGHAEPLLERLSALQAGEHVLVDHPGSAGPVQLERLADADVPAALGFVRAPEEATKQRPGLRP